MGGFVVAMIPFALYIMAQAYEKKNEKVASSFFISIAISIQYTVNRIIGWVIIEQSLGQMAYTIVLVGLVSSILAIALAVRNNNFKFMTYSFYILVMSAFFSTIIMDTPISPQ